MAQPVVKYYTEQAYLALERSSYNKHEYYKGEIFAMGGATFKHSVIQVNLLVKLANHLSDKPGRTFGSGLRIHIPENSLYTYPDVVVVCDEPQFEDDSFDTLLNPAVLIEILSPSTANYDKGAKFELYRDIPSLQEYILIDSVTVHFVSYTRNTDGTWQLAETRDIGGQLIISHIGFQTSLSSIYDGT